ncbi:MAG: MBL fold metallo-hydrolase [Patescibacteria group bacterium]|nr:MBL fold metallo-hydrolase [Patescibacteria group bacterium]
MNNFDLLIDCGPDSGIVSKLGEVMPFWDRKIDYLLLTHPHADHLSGCIDVLKRYEIGQIIATDAVHTTAEYQQWLELIKDKKIPYKLARAGQEISLDNETKLDIYWPDESYQNKNVDNLNNTSVVAKLVYYNFSALLLGDAETEVQKSLLKANSQQLKADILKVAHHGSSNGADLNFLKAIAPEIAIISVGKDNKFGHPTSETLKKLESINAQILRTDLNGTIEIISNGQTFWTNIKN